MSELPGNAPYAEMPMDDGEQVNLHGIPVGGLPDDSGAVRDITFLNDIMVVATVELGRTTLPIREVLKLRRGAIIELDRLVGQPVDLMVNHTIMAKGEIVVVNERFGFRITKFILPAER